MGRAASGRSVIGLFFVLVSLCSAGGANAQSSDVERGRYLVTVGICASCHTPKDAAGAPIVGMKFAGGARVGGILSPNLTSDKETGLGDWTDEQIIEAFRNGKRPDGSTVRPPMGVIFYRDISDADSKAIVAYLRSIPPIRNKVERLPSRGPDPHYAPVKSVSEPDHKDRVVYGRYLAQTIAHCLQCHSPRVNGQPDLSRAGLGGNSYEAPGGGTIASSNITSGNPDGVASWPDDGLKTAITKGVRPDGSSLVPVMDFDMYAALTPDDLDMLVGYIRTLPPIPSP